MVFRNKQSRDQLDSTMPRISSTSRRLCNLLQDFIPNGPLNTLSPKPQTKNPKPQTPRPKPQAQEVPRGYSPRSSGVGCKSLRLGLRRGRLASKAPPPTPKVSLCLCKRVRTDRERERERERDRFSYIYIYIHMHIYIYIYIIIYIYIYRCASDLHR